MPKANRPLFITFEGVEGSGKTSRMGAAARYLESRGHRPRLTREPGGTAIGARIRAILLSPDSGGIDETAELLLYMADRAQHVNTVIRPALAAGETVLCDRYFDATVAYQGHARGLDIRRIRDFHRVALDNFMPDLTLLLDLDPAVGLSRALADAGRPADESRFEHEALAFHNLVRAGYLALADEAPERFAVIDAAQPPEAVEERIVAALTERLNRLAQAIRHG